MLFLLNSLIVVSSRRRVAPRDSNGVRIPKSALQRNPLAKPSQELDCAVKELAYAYSKTLLSSSFHTRRNAISNVKDSLDPTHVCTFDDSAPVAAMSARFLATPAANSIFVNAATGSDSNSGASASEPLKTIHAAQTKARAAGKGTTVFLAKGLYNLAGADEGGSLNLDQRDSGTTYSSIAGEEGDGPVISGGRALTNLKWTAVSPDERARLGLPTASASSSATTTPSSGAGAIYSAKLPSDVDSIAELSVNGVRQIRARFPNANPEVDLYPVGYAVDAGSWGPNKKFPSGTKHVMKKPTQPSPYFAEARWIVGGVGNEFREKWTWTDTQGDWPHDVHSALKFKSSDLPRAEKYTNADLIRVRAFHDDFWGNWGFNVASMTTATEAKAGKGKGGGEFKFSGGGWQEQTGTGDGPDGATNWFVENVLQELDSPLEWYFERSTHTLYYMPKEGANGAPSSSDIFVASELITLIAVNTTAAVPAESNLVTDVTLHGLTFADAAPTFYEPYAASGPGDWSIYPGGALYLRGAANITVSSSLFDSLGGNGIFMHDWVKDCSIVDNEFVKQGDNAIAATGWHSLTDPTDQSASRFPSDNLIEGNHIHNIGIYGKQVSCYHQTIACHNVVRKNVCYDGPRAGINFNDGMGGGNIIEQNLVFNMVRETDDHGPFNAWSRMPFATNRGANAPAVGVLPEITTIQHNFIIMHGSTGEGTTGGLFALCHDDGSAFFVDRFNFLVYGGVKNYLGEQVGVVSGRRGALSFSPFLTLDVPLRRNSLRETSSFSPTRFQTFFPFAGPNKALIHGRPRQTIATSRSERRTPATRASWRGSQRKEATSPQRSAHFRALHSTRWRRAPNRSTSLEMRLTTRTTISKTRPTLSAARRTSTARRW